jgi:hypothetical protein
VSVEKDSLKERFSYKDGKETGIPIGKERKTPIPKTVKEKIKEFDGGESPVKDKAQVVYIHSKKQISLGSVKINANKT